MGRAEGLAAWEAALAVMEVVVAVRAVEVVRGLEAVMAVAVHGR